MVNNSDTKVSYQGNGQTTVFPFSFPFIQRDYIKVAIYDSLTDETKTIDSDYYVDTVANAVIYPGYEPGQEPAEALRPPILPATSTITIYRQTDVDQLTDLGEKYPLKDIENMADKLTEIIQEQAETLGRAVKVPVGDPKTPEEKLTDLQNYVSDAANSAKNAADSEASAQRAAESAATSAANAAESERLAGGYADTATDAASRAEDSAISARAYNAPDYDNAKTYQAGDVITYTDGNSYRALQETTGNEPPNIIYWQRVTDYVGDDFFEVDEYGYIVPMDSPSHSRYWRVDQNGYIVPIEGGDGGYRPDTRSLSAEYLNVTNEGYIKHLRADDIIAKGPAVDVRAFGAVGDGVHDDTQAIQAAIDSGKAVFVPAGTYKTTEPLEFTKFPQFHYYMFCMDINATINYTGNDYALNFLSFGHSIIKLGTINAPNSKGVNITPSRYYDSGGYMNIYNGVIVSGNDAVYIGVSDETAYANNIVLRDIILQGGTNGFHIVNATNHITDYSYLNCFVLENVSFEGMTGQNCIALEATGDSYIEDVFIYNPRLNEALAAGKKFIKTVGNVVRVTGVISDPIISNNRNNLAQYFDIGNGAKDWSLYLSGGLIVNVDNDSNFIVSETDRIKTYHRTIAKNGGTFITGIDTTKANIYRVNAVGTNTSWRYLGFVFVNPSNPSNTVVHNIVNELFNLSVSDNVITLTNTHSDYDIESYITITPINNIVTMI